MADLILRASSVSLEKIKLDSERRDIEIWSNLLACCSSHWSDSRAARTGCHPIRKRKNTDYLVAETEKYERETFSVIKAMRVILGVHSLISAVLISRRHNNGLCLIKPCAMMSMLSLRSKRAYCTTAAFILTSPVETNYVHWDAKGLIKLLCDVPSHVYLQAARCHQLNARSTNKCRQSREAHVWYKWCLHFSNTS